MVSNAFKVVFAITLLLSGFFLFNGQQIIFNTNDASSSNLNIATAGAILKENKISDTSIIIDVYPPKVRPGDVLLVTSKIKSSCKINSVKADITHENGDDTIDLLFFKDSSHWKGSWIVHNTKDQTAYPIVVKVTTDCGDFSAHSAYFDPTVSHSADQIEAGAFMGEGFSFTDDVSFNENVQVDGKVTGELEADKAVITDLQTDKISMGTEEGLGSLHIVGGVASNVKDMPAKANLDNIGFPANLDYLLDSNTNTVGWNTNDASSGALLLVDMGEGNEKDFVKIRLFASAAGYSGTFNIEYSDTGQQDSWSLAASAFTPYRLGWNKIVWSSKGAHRYWRIYMNSVSIGVTFNELEWYVSAPGTTLLVNDDGSISLGTSDTLENKLRIYDESKPANILTESAGDDAYVIIDHEDDHKGGVVINNANGEKWRIINDGSDSDRLKFLSENGNKMSVTQDGKVGIGIESPEKKLHVGGDTQIAQDLTVDGSTTFSGAVDFSKKAISNFIIENTNEDPVTCDDTHKGYIYFDTGNNLFLGCDGSEFKPLSFGRYTIIDAEGGRQWSDGSYAKTCKEYRNPTSTDYTYEGATGTGIYVIDPDGDGGSAAFKVYCEMNRQGGGWTLGIKSWYQGNTYQQAGAIGSVVDAMSIKGSGYKLSDAQIRAVIGDNQKFDVMATQNGYNSHYSNGNYEYAVLRGYTGYFKFNQAMPESTTETTLTSYRNLDDAVAWTGRLKCGYGGAGINCYDVLSGTNPSGGSGCSINMGRSTNGGWHHFYMSETNSDTYLYLCNGAQHSSSYHMNHLWWFKSAD